MAGITLEKYLILTINLENILLQLLKRIAFLIGKCSSSINLDNILLQLFGKKVLEMQKLKSCDCRSYIESVLRAVERAAVM